MSNNLVSQPLSIPSTQMTPLEAIPNRVESSMRDVQMDFPRNVPDESASQPSLLRQQSRSAGTMSLFQNNAGYLDGREKIMMPQRSLVPMEDMGSMFSNQVGQELSMLNKRKAPTGPMPSIHSPRSTIMPNKRAAQVEHRPWLQQSAPIRKSMPGQSTPTPGVKHLPAANKKLGPVESISPRSAPQRLSVPKNQMSNAQPSPKVQSDLSGSVRSKMRESLAAALALVSHEESRSPAGKGSEKSDLSAPSSRVDTRPVPNPGDAVDNLHEVQEGKLTSGNFGSHLVRNSPIASQEAFAIDRSGDSNMPSVSNVQDLQSGGVLIPEDLPFADNFFVKDELLQGNGLSWVLDSDTNMGERMGNQDGKVKEKVPDELNGRSTMAFQSPEVLASRIEAELFKLFGGVNKKYKEKGRSLLFNLKDRSNPELRERVVSGEIPPDRLCSMTAEELASKELSQWRMAKAEELAQMVVLPDSEVDMKRLVKKTHKGEFQVEVDQYDVSAEVPSGVNSSTRDRRKAKNDQESPEKKPGERDENTKAGDRKSDLAVQGAEYTLTIPTEDHASDVDIMEENVTKDLPPIVSLDEFMECLESEPPFRDLQEDAGKSGPASEKDLKSRSPEESPKMAERKSVEILEPASEEDLKTKSPERSPNNTTDMTEEKSSKVDETSSPADVDIRSSDHHGEYDSKDSTVALKGELIWEGSLQLMTTTISVIGIFKSGEKTPSKDWSSSLEIKGRVRLDAFEKFLQDLRMSRSRAIMVVHFICKDSSESERASLCEVADSYVIDERVGFAEPCKGVELYLCPPHAKIREMLSKILPEDHLNVLSDVENGLIGVVVWRRSHLTSAIPSHTTKLTSKKQHFSSRRNQEKDVNFNLNLQHGRLAHPAGRQQPPIVDGDDDDDVPPGFGPGVARAARDEDDLPEFNFSGGSRSIGSNPPQNVSTGSGLGASYGHSRAPVDHIRDLIHKYGQTGVGAPAENYGVPVQPWNDDDDDIPEWNPQGLYNLQQPSRVRPDVHIASARQAQNPAAYLSQEPLARNVQRPAASSLHGGQVYVAPQERQLGRRQDTRRDRGY